MNEAPEKKAPVRYKQCRYPVGEFPNDKPCGRPVPVTQSSDLCEIHTAHIPYWPTDASERL